MLKKKYKKVIQFLVVLFVIISFSNLTYASSKEDQLKKITEDVDKAQIENIDVFYSYLVSLLLVTLVVLSAILAN